MPTPNYQKNYSEDDPKNEQKKSPDIETATGPAMGNLPLSSKEDENNFTSDDQKGKKVDADLDNENEKPGKQ